MGKAVFAAAAYLMALALLSRGPLGLVRVLGPRMHRALDLVLVAGLALSPLFVRGDLDVAGVIVAEALAIVVLRLAFRTQYVPAPAALAPAMAAAAEGPAAAQAAGQGIRGEAASDEQAHAPAPARSTAGGENEAVDEAEDEAEAETTQPETRQPEKTVPSTAWTLGVLAARAQRRHGAGAEKALGEGARRLGAALGRAKRRDPD